MTEFNTKKAYISGKIRRTLLDTLLQIEKDHPGTFTDRDMREEVDTFMFEVN